MRRITPMRSLLLGVVAAAALAATGNGLAAAPKTVTGTVGPGFTIGLVMRGKKGSYRFVCDPHSGIIHGRFNVS